MKNPLNPTYRREKALEKARIDIEHLQTKFKLNKSLLDSPYPEFHKLGKIKLFVEEITPAGSVMVKCKIKDEHFIEFKNMGRKRKVLIGCPPRPFRVPYAWLGLRPSNKICLKFFCGWEAEVTHDPLNAQLDIPTITHALKLSEIVSSGGGFVAMNKAVMNNKNLWVFLGWIASWVTALVAIYFLGGGL